MCQKSFCLIEACHTSSTPHPTKLCRLCAKALILVIRIKHAFSKFPLLLAMHYASTSSA